MQITHDEHRRSPAVKSLSKGRNCAERKTSAHDPSLSMHIRRRPYDWIPKLRSRSCDRDVLVQQVYCILSTWFAGVDVGNLLKSGLWDMQVLAAYDRSGRLSTRERLYRLAIAQLTMLV